MRPGPRPGEPYGAFRIDLRIILPAGFETDVHVNTRAKADMFSGKVLIFSPAVTGQTNSNTDKNANPQQWPEGYVFLLKDIAMASVSLSSAGG